MSVHPGLVVGGRITGLTFELLHHETKKLGAFY